jgi:hypothetical protein
MITIAIATLMLGIYFPPLQFRDQGYAHSAIHHLKVLDPLKGMVLNPSWPKMD